MATQNIVGPSDKNEGSPIGNIDFEGLGLEKEMVKGLKAAYDYVDKILKAMEKVEKSSGKIGKNLTGKGTAGQNIGLGNISSGWGSMTGGQRAMTVGMGAVALGSIGMSMAPNTMAAVTQRMAADTVAGISGMSAKQLIGTANKAVGGGVTGMGSPTMAAMGILYGGGYTANSLSSRNIMSQVAGLSAITGGTNQQVAMAMAQANGMNFLRAGINIRNQNGQLKPPNEIINAAYNFMYRGRKITAEQAAMVYNPGSKAYYTLSQMAGGNADLMGILQAGVVARARGGGGALKADTLGNAQKSLDLLGVGKDAPSRALFKYNTSENRVLQSTQQGLVGGYNAGLGAATSLNNAFASVAEAAQGVTNALMGLKGFLQTFPAAGNVAGTASGLVSTGLGMGMNVLSTRYALKSAGLATEGTAVAGLTGKAAKAAKAAQAAQAAAKAARLAKFMKFAKIGGPLAALGAGYEGYQARKAHHGFDWASLLKATGEGALVGGVAGGVVSGGAAAIPGAILGGLWSGGGNLLGQLFAGGGQGGPTDSSGDSGHSGNAGLRQLISPVPRGAKVNSGYGMRTYKGRDGKTIKGMHRGIDYGVKENSPLYAVDNGVVLRTSRDPNGYGNYSIIQHGDGNQSLYGHLNKFVALSGSKVRAGDIVGLSGGRPGAVGAGNSTGEHLHFEYGRSVGAGKGQINPLPLFKKGSWISNLFAEVKNFLGIGPSPRGRNYGTETNINMNIKGMTTGTLSSNDISTLLGGLTHGQGAINYEDILKHLGKGAAKRITDQPIDYSNLSGGTGKVSHKELMSLMYRKGFRGKALDTAFSVAMAESGGRPKAFNNNSKTGDLSYGLMQINMIGTLGPDRRKKYNLSKNEELFVPDINTDVGYKMSHGGKSWGPWRSYTKGRFAKFLADAAATREALNLPGKASGGSVSASSAYVVGEGGPEVFVPEVGGTIIPNHKAKGMGLGPGGRTAIINVKMDVNIAQAGVAEAEHMIHIFADRLERKLKLNEIAIF